MTKTQQKINDLVGALACALENAQEEGMRNPEDGGTCNFDSCEVSLKGWRASDVQEAARLVGLRAYKWSSGYWHFNGYEKGQGDLRTRMVEKFTETMRVFGYTAFTYYAMD